MASVYMAVRQHHPQIVDRPALKLGKNEGQNTIPEEAERIRDGVVEKKIHVGEGTEWVPRRLVLCYDHLFVCRVNSGKIMERIPLAEIEDVFDPKSGTVAGLVPAPGEPALSSPKNMARMVYRALSGGGGGADNRCESAAGSSMISVMQDEAQDSPTAHSTTTNTTTTKMEIATVSGGYNGGRR